MTDILIRGVEMPDKKPICVVIDAAGQARLYNLLSDCYCDNELYEAVELPPHGALIDRDALPQDRVEWEDVVNAPIVIPAEREETHD